MQAHLSGIKHHFLSWFTFRFTEIFGSKHTYLSASRKWQLTCKAWCHAWLLVPLIHFQQEIWNTCHCLPLVRACGPSSQGGMIHSTGHVGHLLFHKWCCKLFKCLMKCNAVKGEERECESLLTERQNWPWKPQNDTSTSFPLHSGAAV